MGALRKTNSCCAQNDRVLLCAQNHRKYQVMKQFFVYIATNRSGTLYTGVTNDLERRMYEHKHRLVSGFTSKYKIDRLVYFEQTTNVEAAIKREKQIKGWLRAKKTALIETENTDWDDLSAEWYE